MFEKVAGYIKAHPRASKIAAVITGTLIAVGITALVVTRDNDSMLIEGTVIEEVPFIEDKAS